MLKPFIVRPDSKDMIKPFTYLENGEMIKPFQIYDDSKVSYIADILNQTIQGG